MIKKSKKEKSAKITLTISAKQKKVFTESCSLNDTVPKQFLKDAIKEYIEKNVEKLKQRKAIPKNQLGLFDHIDNTGVQLQITVE